MERLLVRVAELGGAAATHELYAIGATREQLRLAVRAGVIRRIRYGWYIDPDTPAALADALRVGGRATCASVVAHHGLWLRKPPACVHVAVAPNACQLRNPGDYRRRFEGGAVVHWSDRGQGPSRLVVPLIPSLLEFADCQGAEDAFAAAESALARRLFTVEQWRRACAESSAAHAARLAFASVLSGSGTESVFVFRMRWLGIRVRQQVKIGADRVDGLIGDRLVVELDSREFHERERDYARDARLGARGYRTLRFSYRQVMFEWPQVEAAVLAALAREDHR